jgi:hypothetical protein
LKSGRVMLKRKKNSGIVAEASDVESMECGLALCAGVPANWKASMSARGRGM